jgi:LysR family hydrogen peroxide-inducible transcriptional activator
MITLRQLRYFDALLRHRHFGRAAEACNVSQPALSMQIRDLEKLLGATLVERRTGQVVPTEIGAVVARRTEAILGAVHDLTALAQSARRPLSGSLRLGVIPSLAPYVLPRVLPRLQESHPDLRLEVHETQTKALLSELAIGALDTAMLALPVEDADVATLPLFEDPFLLALPAADPLPAGTRALATHVDQRRLILLEEGHCLRDQALAYCTMARRDSITSLGASSLATVMQLVANNYGVTLVPEIASDTEVRDDRVKLLRFAAPEPKRTIGLAWRPTSPRVEDFLLLARLVTDALGVTTLPQPHFPP